MKTLASILVFVSAMVCFSANAADIPKAFELTKGNPRANLSDWYLYTIPVSENAAGNYVEDIDPTRCTCNGIKLYGKVKVVESFPDLKVKIVESFPDLKVKVVSVFPDECGEWQFVEHFPDFTIKYVESFPDVKIKFVESFPGM